MLQPKFNSIGPRFQKIKRIGEGTYGTVTKVFDNKLKIFLAMKKIKFHDKDQTIPINALRQITSLKELNHPNILKLYSVNYESEKRKLYMTFEYIEQTLYQNICKNKSLSCNTIKIYTYQILKGLNYLLSKGYMHRDLKPQNIMITKNYDIKIIDFGQVKKINLINFGKQINTLEISTLWYKAPQILLGHEYYNNKIDIWALGCIIVEMITGIPLFQGKSQIQQIFKIFQCFGTPKIISIQEIKKWKYMNNNFPKFQGHLLYISSLGQQGNDLLKKMLQLNPQKRININQAMKHKFFQGIQ